VNRERSGRSPVAVEICGGIAYGKTTLAHLFQRLAIKPTLEDFQANPFYSAFYEDPASFAFEAEITFTLQHYHQIKRSKSLGRAFCTDFSLYLDLAYSKVTLEGNQLAAYKKVYEAARDEIEAPSLLVHLECDPEVALARIRRRGRSAELGLELPYLKTLDLAVRDIADAAQASTHVLRIDSQALDFANDEEDGARVLELIRSTIAVLR
jgi:deoxyadenosine/deoxycytidine kinase